MVEMLSGEHFGDYFRRLRKAKGFKSQKDLALASAGKVSQATLSRIEDNQQKPFPETLKILAETLDEPYEKLMIAAGYIEKKTVGNPYRINVESGGITQMTDEEVIEDELSQKEYVVKKALQDAIRDTRENNKIGDGDKKLIIEVLDEAQENFRYPASANSRDIKDLSIFLEKSEIMFDGVPMTDEVKARVRGFMEAMFWDAKQKNKKKKNKEN